MYFQLRGLPDPVDEAAIESFPASDPPAFTRTHIGQSVDDLHIADDDKPRA